VCDFLEERGIEMVLSHPSKTRIIAEAKIKTDKIDSKNLAKLLRADFLPQPYIPSKEIIEAVEKYGEDFFIGVILKKGQWKRIIE
jgi:transposase